MGLGIAVKWGARGQNLMGRPFYYHGKKLRFELDRVVPPWYYHKAAGQ